MKNLVYDEAKCGGEWRAPRPIVDMMALVGDAVDNIPGAPGIAQKARAPDFAFWDA